MQELDSTEPIPAEIAEPSASPTALHAPLVATLLEGDLGLSERVYQAIEHERGAEDLALTLIEPAPIEIGEHWFHGRCAVEQERVATTFLLNKLRGILESSRRANPTPSHTILICSLSGERHEGGSLLFSWMLEMTGWRALLLGPDIPIQVLEQAVHRWRPEAVGVSFVLSRNINKRFKELTRLSQVPVFVGGRSILNYQGLARRHGLIPLAGPANRVIRGFHQELGRWQQTHAAGGGESYPWGPPRRLA